MEDETDIRDKAELWKTSIRAKYNIEDKYEIAFIYSNPVGYMETEEKLNKFLLIDKKNQLWCYEDGKIYMPITREQHIHRPEASPMRDIKGIKQWHVDLFGHFIQVNTVLQHSKWFKHPPRFQYNMNSDGQERGDMPSLEDTVFAMIYVRQFTGKDNLLVRTCKEYMRFIDDSERRNYVKERKKEFEDFLKESPRCVPVSKHVNSNLNLLNAFLYGAMIVHGPKESDQKYKDNYEKIYMDKSRRVETIFELNDVMHQIVSISSGVASLLYKDFADWQSKGLVPAPNVFWQHTIFSWEPTIEKE